MPENFLEQDNLEVAPNLDRFDRRIQILGVGVSLVNLEIATARIVSWAKMRVSHYVCVRDVHGIMQAQDDPEFVKIHENAGLVTPDGMPLVWISRLRGFRSVRRVCGADLVDELCAASVPLGLRHFFFGGKPGVAQRMAMHLSARHPGLEVAGTMCPSFEELSAEEDEEVISSISKTTPNIIWVGMSTPKQEYWMRDHVGKIPGATIIGVGAAFDFYAGDVVRAPLWMQRSGFEWLHRLCSEPRRLWRRYLVLAPKFVFRFVITELFLHGKNRSS